MKSPSGRTLDGILPGLLVFLAFTAPGAWFVFALPPVPISKALTLLTVAVWLLAFGLGWVRWARPETRVLWALGAVVAWVLVSLAIGGSWFQVVFYDLYSNMPLVQWLVFPAIFLLAAGVTQSRDRVEAALLAIVIFGAALAAVEAYQQLATSTPRVFGSTGYSKAALAPLIPLAVAMAAKRAGGLRIALYVAAAIIALDVGVLAGSTMGAIVVGFALVASVFVHPVSWRSDSGVPLILRRSSMAVAALMVAGMVWAQVPALSGKWINPETLASGGTSVVSRLQMWQGAQAMVAERPLTGHGPGGYRIRAAEYLSAQALQYGADAQGNIDPSVFSPQSPHSILWEIGTRLGLIGLGAFVALLGVWATSVSRRIGVDAESAATRRGLGAALVTALFALSVDPVIFAIGLLAPLVAGLAIAPFEQGGTKAPPNTRSWGRVGLAVAGVGVAAVALWLGVGEWRVATTSSNDPVELLAGRQAVLGVLPGHPPTQRQVLEMRLLTAFDGAEVMQVQADVDAAPSYIPRFAPGMVSLVAYSLAQAERTERTDLSWEDATLARAEQVLPPIPSLVAERLHLAVLSGDRAAVQGALPDALTWGAPYPLTESYVDRARVLVDSD